MKEFCAAIIHLAFLILAYSIARTEGYLAGKGIDLPFLVNVAFGTVFILLITLSQSGGKK